jgi:hypothetical protein
MALSATHNNNPEWGVSGSGALGGAKAAVGLAKNGIAQKIFLLPAIILLPFGQSCDSFPPRMI